MNPSSTGFVSGCISCNRNNEHGALCNSTPLQHPCLETNCNHSSAFDQYQPIPPYQQSPSNFHHPQQQQQRQPNMANILLRSALSSGCNLIRGPLPVTTEVITTCNNDGESQPVDGLLSEVLQRSMTNIYHRIRSQCVNKEKQLRDLVQRCNDLTAITEKLKKEVTQVSRERIMAVHELEKVKKVVDDERQKTQANVITINKLNDGLRAQTKEQAMQISLLEKRNKEVETKYNELLSSHVDLKVEHLLGQNHRANLADQVTSLKKNVHAQKMKASALALQCSHFARENERLQMYVELQGLELKAEKLLKEQILNEEAEALRKPSLLNQMLMQKTDPKYVSALPSKRGEEEDHLGRKSDMLALVRHTSCSHEALVATDGAAQSHVVQPIYDQLISGIKRLKDKFYTEETRFKRKAPQKVSILSTVKKARVGQPEQTSSSGLSESEHGGDEFESGVEENDSDADASMYDINNSNELAISSGLVSQETQTDDLFILVHKPKSVGTSKKQMGSTTNSKIVNLNIPRINRFT